MNIQKSTHSYHQVPPKHWLIIIYGVASLGIHRYQGETAARQLIEHGGELKIACAQGLPIVPPLHSTSFGRGGESKFLALEKLPDAPRCSQILPIPFFVGLDSSSTPTKHIMYTAFGQFITSTSCLPKERSGAL